jgi:hypothetical protein
MNTTEKVRDWHEKKMLRQVTTLSTLFFFFLLSFSSCSSAEKDDHRVESEWRRHEQVLIDLHDGKDIRAADFNEACLFFSELTDIEIPSNHDLFIDCYPTEDSPKALEPLRNWYSRNRHRLYWDDKTKSVKIKKFGGFANGRQRTAWPAVTSQ